MLFVDDACINSLIGRPELVREFSFLLAALQDTDCCGGRPRLVPNYPAIKAILAGMPSERKELFKRLVGVSRCRVVFRNGNASGDVTF